jgi:hypothetical protein
MISGEMSMGDMKKLFPFGVKTVSVPWLPGRTVSGGNKQGGSKFYVNGESEVV